MICTDTAGRATINIIDIPEKVEPFTLSLSQLSRVRVTRFWRVLSVESLTGIKLPIKYFSSHYLNLQYGKCRICDNLLPFKFTPHKVTFILTFRSSTMAKGKKRNRNSDGWTASDHIAQAEKKKERRDARMSKKQNESNNSATTTTKLQKSDRTSLLTHNTQEKRDAARLQLHITKVQREINDLKQRLSNWDPVREEQRKQDKLRKEQETMTNDTMEDYAPPKKKRGRLGPESWKLRGAARPAWEVYDFDTRYVDPYVKDHEQAAAAVARSQNLLLRRPSPTNGQGIYMLHSVAPDEAREYLGLLMQLGYLCQEAKQYKTARAAFLECIELEGDDTLDVSTSITAVTSAREALMRMYLDLERHDAAYRLGERLKLDTSCVIRFTMAVVAMHLQKDDDIITELLVQAIKSNIFATYYLCYFDIFKSAIEFTDDLAECDDEPQSTFEEALEYCSSKYAVLWKKTDGALLRLNSVLHSSSGIISVSDLEWDNRLSQIESQYNSRRDGGETNIDDDTNDSSPPEGLDVAMFAGMYRTAMDMAQECDKYELR